MRLPAARHLLWLCAPVTLALAPALMTAMDDPSGGSEAMVEVFLPLSTIASLAGLAGALATLRRRTGLPAATRTAWTVASCAAAVAYAPVALLLMAFCVGVWAWPLLGDAHHVGIEATVRTLVLASALLVMPGIAAAVVAFAALIRVTVLAGGRRREEPDAGPETRRQRQGGK
jgi:hypothetical protein